MLLDRRIFLGAAVATPIAFSPAAFRVAAAVPRIRKSVTSLPTNAPDLLDYARAVKMMTELPEGDRRNWHRQAEIHNQFCPHSNWWFLPWHRAYLWYFEQCCRDVLQNPDFCLPYWDWTQYPRVPGPFWQGSLAHDREVTPNDDMPSEFVGSAKIRDILGSSGLTPIFSGATTNDNQREQSAQGDFESGPHNSVHSTISGDMGTFLSPLDPIFWLHHANIDRLWASWARANPNRFPSEPLWKNHVLQTFYDPTTKSNATPAVDRLKKPEDWGSTYDHYEPVAKIAETPFTSANFVLAPGKIAAAATGALKFVQISSSVDPSGVKFGSSAQLAMKPTAPLSSLWAGVPKSVPTSPSADAYLAIDGVQRPQVPNAAMRVFLNCKNPGTQTPLDDPTYVGSVTFFDGHADHGATTNFILDASRTLRRLSELGIYQSDTPIDVALVVFDTRHPNALQSEQVIRPQRVRLVGVG